MADLRMMMLERQRDAFRVGFRDSRLTRAQVLHRWGMEQNHESTLRNWVLGKAEMPLHRLGDFARTFSAEATTLLLDDGQALVLLGDSAADHDDLAGQALGFAGAVAAARHPASEAGTDIGPREADELAARRAGLMGA